MQRERSTLEAQRAARSRSANSEPYTRRLLLQFAFFEALLAVAPRGARAAGALRLRRPPPSYAWRNQAKPKVRIPPAGEEARLRAHALGEASLNSVGGLNRPGNALHVDPNFVPPSITHAEPIFHVDPGKAAKVSPDDLVDSNFVLPWEREPKPERSVHTIVDDFINPKSGLAKERPDLDVLPNFQLHLAPVPRRGLEFARTQMASRMLPFSPDLAAVIRSLPLDSGVSWEARGHSLDRISLAAAWTQPDDVTLYDRSSGALRRIEGAAAQEYDESDVVANRQFYYQAGLRTISLAMRQHQSTQFTSEDELRETIHGSLQNAEAYTLQEEELLDSQADVREVHSRMVYHYYPNDRRLAMYAPPDTLDATIREAEIPLDGLLYGGVADVVNNNGGRIAGDWMTVMRNALLESWLTPVGRG